MPALLAMLVTFMPRRRCEGAIRVPGASGSIVFRIRTGIRFSTAGWMVAGWITLAP